MITKILNIFLILFITIFQVAFLSGLPGYSGQANLILIAMIFYLLIGGLDSGLVFVLISGYVADIFLFSPFGSNLLGLFASLILANFLLGKFFTNRSLYSLLALVFFSTLCFEITHNIYDIAYNFFIKNDNFLNFGLNFWLNELSQIILNLLCVVVIFYFYNFLSNRFKPVFLVKGN